MRRSRFYLGILVIVWLTHVMGLAQTQELHFNYENTSDSLLVLLQRQLKASQQIPDASGAIFQNHLKLGEYYHTLGLFSEAMNQYNLASQQLDAQLADTLYVSLNNNMGKVHQALNNFGLAQQYFIDAMNTSEDLNYLRGQAKSSAFLGSSYEKQGVYTKALEHQNQSLDLFEQLGDSYGTAITNENIGSIYEDLENFEKAHDHFKKAYSFFKNSHTAEEANVLNNLGDSYRKTGNYPSALRYTQRSLEVATSLGDYHQLESAHKDLSKTYALQGDFKKAHKELMVSETYNSAMLKARNTSQLNVLQTIYEMNKKEAEISLLKEQNKVSAARQNLLWVALFAIAVILSILYTYLGRKRKAKLKLQTYKQRMLKAELDKRAVEEKNLQREVQLKTASLSRYSLHLSQKNKILLDLANTLRNIASRQHMDFSSKIKQLVKEIDFNLQQEHEWDEFMNFFKEIHPEFIKKLSSLTENNLSPAELRLGMLLRLNLSSKEIASILRVTPDSVRVARHRLRKKLPIDQKEELVSFMIEL